MSIPGTFEVTVVKNPVSSVSVGNITVFENTHGRWINGEGGSRYYSYNNLNPKFVVTFDDGHTGGTATCHSKAVCTRCGTEYGEVDLRNHDGETKIINAVAATCVENGYSGDIYCLSCNSLVSSGSETPLAEHTVGDWLSDADGHWHHCSVCDSDVDRGEHRFIWRVTKKATSAENGLKEELCSVCGYKSGKSETIEYAGYEPDDINNDGVVNNQDIARLFQYLSGWGVPVNNRAIDVNKDGNVNNQDLVFLFQALSGWEVDLV